MFLKCLSPLFYRMKVERERFHVTVCLFSNRSQMTWKWSTVKAVLSGHPLLEDTSLSPSSSRRNIERGVLQKISTILVYLSRSSAGLFPKFSGWSRQNSYHSDQNLGNFRVNGKRRACVLSKLLLTKLKESDLHVSSWGKPKHSTSRSLLSCQDDLKFSPFYLMVCTSYHEV